MSLINKMLLDLEARQPTLAPAAAAQAIYQDLHAANSSPPPAPRVRMSLIFALLGVGATALSLWVGMPSGVIPVPVETAPAPSSMQVEPLPVTPPPAEIAKAPVHEIFPAAPAPVAETAGPESVLDTHTALPEHIDAVPPPAPPSTANAAPINVEPVSVIKTAHIIPPAQQAQNAYQDGQRSYAEQNYAEAEHQWRMALESDAQHHAARAQLAALLLAGGRGAEAQTLLEQGMTLAPEHAEFPLLLARIQVERGQEREALAMLEQASERTHADVDISAFIAALLQRADRHAEAAKYYQLALALRPQEGRWWMGLAISLEAEQSWPAARDAYTRAINTPLTAELIRYAEQRLVALRGNH